MTNREPALIGVLGGMGPSATIDFLTKLRAATPAARDQDHVPLIVHCVPQIPDRVAAILNGGDAPFAPLLAAVRVLERAGVMAIVMPCNSAHHWHRRLSQEAKVPILHIAHAVRDQLRQAGTPAGRVALMATRGTVAARLYDDAFDAGIAELLLPGEGAQNAIDRAIADVKAGRMVQARASAAEAAGILLDEQRADRLLLGCTELPIALEGSGRQGSCIDATLALARACVKLSLGFTTEGLTP
jgi:aspartate racemase